MLDVTPEGRRAFTEAVTDELRNVHLFTEDGELTDHGYMSLPLIPSRWNGGAYPDQAWVFEAGTPVDVLGYYVTTGNGTMAFSEAFTATDEHGDKVEAPMAIKNTGDRIAVSLKFNLL